MNNKEKGKSNPGSGRGNSRNTGAPKFSGRRNEGRGDEGKFYKRNERNGDGKPFRRNNDDSGKYTGPKNKSADKYKKEESFDKRDNERGEGSYRERRASELNSNKGSFRDSRKSDNRNRSRSREDHFDNDHRDSYRENRSDSDRGKSRSSRFEEGGDKKPFRSDRRSEGGDRKYSNDRGEKRSYRKDGDSKGYNREDRGEKRSFRKDGDSRDFKRKDRGEKRSYRKDGDSSDGGRDNRFDDKRGEKRSFGSDRREDSRGKRSDRRDSGFEKSGYRDREEKRRPKTREYKDKDRESIGDWRSERPKSSLRPESKEKEFRGGNPITEPVRLNKFISNAGICSRREADQHIENGAVTVNGVVVMELGAKVNPGDEVRFKTRLVLPEKPVYVLMNKPKDCITSSDDPEGRKTVLDLIGDAVQERIFPVGRLDRNTTGVLLLTNDGDLAQKLTHPSYGIQKIYKADLDKPMSKEDFAKLEAGVELEDGFIKPDELAYLDDSGSVLGIEIHSGKNHIVHRMFNSLGYLIEKLDRVSFAGLTKDGLKRGEIRMLSDKDLLTLRKSVGKAGMGVQ